MLDNVNGGPLSIAENNRLDRIGLVKDRKQQFTLYCDLAATSTKEWLVKNLLGHAEASAFYGAPGSGKSALVEDMGLHIAAGRSWHGREVKQGAVCYIALERRLLVERRAIAFRERHGIPDLPFAIIGGVYDFRDPRTAATVGGIVRQVEDATDQKVILCQIDTRSRALAGGDENSSRDMGAIVNTTSRLFGGFALVNDHGTPEIFYCFAFDEDRNKRDVCFCFGWRCFALFRVGLLYFGLKTRHPVARFRPNGFTQFRHLRSVSQRIRNPSAD